MPADQINPLDEPAPVLVAGSKPRTKVVNASPEPVEITAHPADSTREVTFRFEPWQSWDVPTEWMHSPVIRNVPRGKPVRGMSVLEKLAPQLIPADDPRAAIAQRLCKDHRHVTTEERDKARREIGEEAKAVPASAPKKQTT